MDNNAVLKQCFETLGKLSTKVEPPKLTDTYFPRLPQLNCHEVHHIQEKCSSNKAETFDFISDKWLRLTKRCDFLGDLWNHNTIQMLEKSFEARLVPLNKVWPAIPKGDEFRPIVIESPM